MIFHRALKREMTQVAGAVFVTLFTIMLTTQSIRLLGQAAGGKLASEAVLSLLGFAALNYLPVLLSLTVFIAILMTLSRQYKDSEMTIWFASGLSLANWVRPVASFAWPFVLIIAVLSFVGAPWAVQQSERYREKLENQDDAAKLSPGAFRESAGAERVFFVESIAPGVGTVQNVFVNSFQGGKLGLMVAQKGFAEIAPNGDKFLVLQNGRRYEGKPGELDYRILDFERYAVRVEDNVQRTQSTGGAKQLPTFELILNRTDANKGEMVWRIGLPLSALTLAFLAIPLAFVNPRAGRSANLLLALLIYMVYNNGLSIVQAWVAQGKMGFFSAWWLVHAAMVLLLLVMFWRRLATHVRLSPFRRA
jgi:lipopolysaccharide export system permease protein